MYFGVLALATLAVLMTMAPALAGAETGKFEGTFYPGPYTVDYRGNYVFNVFPDASGKLHFNLKLNVAFKVYEGEEFVTTGHFNGQIDGWFEDLANNNVIIRGNFRVAKTDIEFHIIVRIADGVPTFKIVPPP